MEKRQTILNRMLSIILIVALSISMVGNILEYARADAYSTLGTNKALGSPVLNPNFSADDWNKWEMITWGIFLSNFAIPFVDDYNSAFNLNSGKGSEGSGVKALKFGSGNDPANNKVLQDLLDYAINQQIQGGVKPIKVSYTEMSDGKFTAKSQFTTSAGTMNIFGSGLSSTPSTDTSTDTDTDTDSSTEVSDESDIQGEGSPSSALIRDATVADLLFSVGGSGITHASGESNTTWAGSTSNNAIFRTALDTSNYVDLNSILEGSFPTFAILTSTNTYETVLDYTDAYDLSVISGVLARGLGSGADIQKKFATEISKMCGNPESYKLYLDCFGNITTMVDGSYRVIIPASANKYLTKNPSINLVNSLIFNANVSTAGQEDLVLHAGQSTKFQLSLGSFEDWNGGGLAISNGAKGVPAGTSLLFYDTDTIVMQKALAEGVSLESGKGKYDVNVGEVYKELFSLDITKQSQPYAFKIEQANVNNLNYDSLDEKSKSAVSGTFLASSQLINIFNTAPSTPVLTSINTDTGEVSLFDEPVVIPVQMEDSSKKSASGNLADFFTGKIKYSSRAIYRRFVNWVYQASQKDYSTTAGTVSRVDILAALDKSKTSNELFENLMLESDGKNLSTLFKAFVLRRTDLYKSTSIGELNTTTYSSSLDGPQDMLIGGSTSKKSIKTTDAVDTTILATSASKTDGEGQDRSPFSRSIKAYATSEVMRSVANILGVREGTDFAVFSTYIYLTYLNWYGVIGTTKSKLSGEDDSANFNTRIFDTSSDILNADINKIVTVMSDEEKEKAILDWTYTLLNPTEGRAYRSNMIISAVSDFIYDNYQKIVYGNASSYYDTGTGVTSRNSTGFLSLQPYSENFGTAWFVNNYAYMATILIGFFVVLTIIMGLLKKRKISWYLVSVIVMVNMILVLPASGEVAPLLANSFVQDMFSDKMTYWGISEQVQNAKMEADYVSGNTISTGFMNSLSSQEQQQVVNLVKNLNVLYTDRSLVLKQDISKKVSAIANSTYEDVQQLRSARWMLPMIMREFTESEDNANYVYVPMSDKLDDLSNLYWYYRPEVAMYSKTINGQQNGSDIPSIDDSISYKSIDGRGNIFGPYKNTASGYNSDEGDIQYKQKSYNAGVGTAENTHTYSYMLNSAVLSQYNIPEYTDGMSYSDWATQAAEAAVSCFRTTQDIAATEATMESMAGEYNRFDRATIDACYGYLWATENPLHFFYQGITECFNDDITTGAVIGELYGEYVEGSEGGEEKHKTFMHDPETGALRDLLDFEEMFTNMIPYMYAMQLGAEGYDGVDGYFEGQMIEGYPKHEFLEKSWMFRSNWVTKIMESSELHGVGHIKLQDGTAVTVPNMLLPSCYPGSENTSSDDIGRPMIFSEAQMKKYGLSESDLSLVELKCLAVNKAVYQKWTLLINYAAVKGLTKEVLVRQMALDALFEFNREFSPVGIIGAAYQMYPIGLDLRSISFDSVMKMLMLNVTHDTAYIYGDTMQTIIEDADIFTALLLLITALICAFLIPLARNVLMSVIFYIGLWAILWSIMKNTKTKAKVTCGYMVSNFVFLIMTFMYYMVIKALVAMSSTDEVLTLSQIEINTGNPVWCLIVVLAASLAYVYMMYKLLCMVVGSYRDMGFEIYAGIAELAARGVSNKLEKVGTSLSTSFGASVHSLSNSSGNSKTQGRPKKTPIDVRDVSEDRAMYSGGDNKGPGRPKTKPESAEDDYTTSGYTDGRYRDGDSGTSRDIDKEINKGKEMEKQEKKAEQNKTSNDGNSNRRQSPK